MSNIGKCDFMTRPLDQSLISRDFESNIDRAISKNLWQFLACICFSKTKVQLQFFLSKFKTILLSSEYSQDYWIFYCIGCLKAFNLNRFNSQTFSIQFVDWLLWVFVNLYICVFVVGLLLQKNVSLLVNGCLKSINWNRNVTQFPSPPSRVWADC